MTLVHYHDRATPVPAGWRVAGPAPGHHGRTYLILEATMKISERGIDLIRHHEGCRLQAYQDSNGVWTIGYGHTGPNVYQGKEITLDRAEALLRDDVRWAEQAVRELVDAELSQAQYDALVSFVFNVGRAAFMDSDLRAAVNAGEPTTVAMELPRWRRAGGEPLLGLSRRRIAEARLYLDGS